MGSTRNGREQNRSTQMCLLCKNHYIDQPKKNHRNCKYEKAHDCPKMLCEKTKELRRGNAEVIAKRRKRINVDSQAQVPLPDKRIRHAKECLKCWNHNVASLLVEDHRKICEFRDCEKVECGCDVVHGVREKTRIQNQNRRRRNKELAEYNSEIDKRVSELPELKSLVDDALYLEMKGWPGLKLPDLPQDAAIQSLIEVYLVESFGAERDSELSLDITEESAEDSDNSSDSGIGSVSGDSVFHSDTSNFYSDTSNEGY